jgi:hypothetical protein
MKKLNNLFVIWQRHANCKELQIMQVYHHHFNKNLEPSTHASGFLYPLRLKAAQTLTSLFTISTLQPSPPQIGKRGFWHITCTLFFPTPSSSFSVVVIHSDQLLLSFLVVYIGSKKGKFQSGVRLQEKEGKQKIGFLEYLHSVPRRRRRRINRRVELSD